MSKREKLFNTWFKHIAFINKFTDEEIEEVNQAIKYIWNEAVQECSQRFEGDVEFNDSIAETDLRTLEEGTDYTVGFSRVSILEVKNLINE